MRILYVIPYYVPAWDYGGPVQVAGRITAEMARRGHEVTVYTTDALSATGRAGKSEETIEGIQVKRFRNLSNRLAYRNKIFFAPGLGAAARGQPGRFDIIHLHEYRTLQNVAAGSFARRRGIPYVLQAHGSLPRIMAKQGMKRVFDLLWGRRLLREAAGLIALTETEVEQYRGCGVEDARITIIPNGVDLDEFRDLPERGEFRTRYDIPEEARLVLYLGRLHRSKGVDLLLRAFAPIAGKSEDARLAVVGPDDGLLPELRSLAQQLGMTDRIVFTGAVYGSERLQAFRDADVFVCPSFMGFPVAILEAMASGRPVVTTTKGDRLGWLDGQVGFVTDDDEDGLRKAIERVLFEPETARKLGQNAQRLVQEHFSWSKIADQLEALYLKVIEGRND